MAITIEATPGASDANSFVTEAEQIAYMEARLNADDWTTFSGAALTDDENKALVEATRDITRMTGFDGERVTSTQALAWPRQNAFDPDDPNRDYFAETVIPQRVKNATMELAFQYVKAGTTDVAAAPDTDGIKRKKVDVLETEYFEFGQDSGIARYPRVIGELSPLLVGGGSGINAPLIRG